MKKYVIVFISLLMASCAGMKKANDFYDSKNYDKAISECKLAIEKDSTNAEAYLILGKSYRATNKIKEANSLLNIALKLQPASSNLLSKIRKELIAVKLIKAKEFLDKSENYYAIQEYKSILEMDSTDYSVISKLADCYLESRYLNKANVYYLKLLTVNPNDSKITSKKAVIDSLSKIAEANFKKGSTYYFKNKSYSALKRFKVALDNKKDHHLAKYYLHMSKGRVFLKKGSKSNCWDAIEEFGKAMVIRPELAEPNYYMAKAYEKKDRDEFDNAIEEYKNSLNKEPAGSFARVSKKKIKELTKRKNKMKNFWGK